MLPNSCNTYKYMMATSVIFHTTLAAKLSFPSSECIEKFGAELGLEVWEATNKAFDTLPIAAVIDKKVWVLSAVYG